MLRIGDKVRVNYNSLDIGCLDSGVYNKEYSNYIQNNIDKEYEIIDIVDCACPFVLNDEYLNTTSFDEDELILITE